MKFHIGDKVKVVKYGNLIGVPKTPGWDEYYKGKVPYQEGENTRVFDIAPERVGTIDIVTGESNNRYSLLHSAWYAEEQLEMVEKNNVFEDDKITRSY